MSEAINYLQRNTSIEQSLRTNIPRAEVPNNNWVVTHLVLQSD